jgi:hypothetical protein
MAEHHHVVERVERDNTGSGMAGGLIIGLVLLLFVAVLAYFVFGGGPGRFAGAPAAPGQTNVNVPAQNQPSGGPNIQVPRQIDVNVNQPAAPAQQAPAQQAPAGAGR